MSATVFEEHAYQVRLQRVEIRPIAGSFAAEVVGLDLHQPLDETDFRRIHRAHLDHHVLVFRDQRITPAQQVAFSRRFGPLQIHVLHQFQLQGQPEVLIVSNIVENGQPIGLGDAGHFWHSDLSYVDKPSLGSMLLAQELPAEGGDTLFADQHAAWVALPPELKQRVRTLRAEHSYLAKYAALRARSPWRPKLSDEQVAQVKPVVHPVVRTHPETGRLARIFHQCVARRPEGMSQGPGGHHEDLLEWMLRSQQQPHAAGVAKHRRADLQQLRADRGRAGLLKLRALERHLA